MLALLRHDRTLVLAGLAAAVALAWVWLLTGAGLHMDEMDMDGGRIMLMAPSWTAGYAAMVLLMWIVMMAAMMLPSAAPTILLAAALARARGERHAGGQQGRLVEYRGRCGGRVRHRTHDSEGGVDQSRGLVMRQVQVGARGDRDLTVAVVEDQIEMNTGPKMVRGIRLAEQRGPRRAQVDEGRVDGDRRDAVFERLQPNRRLGG